MKTSELLETEYPPYYHPYIMGLGEVGLFTTLEWGEKDMENIITDIPDSKLYYAYAQGKWTVAEVLLHIIDAERVFQYRALCFGRGDKTSLPGFDENAYVPSSYANQRTKTDLLEEYKAVRKSTLALFKSFHPDALHTKGTANGNKISVQAIGFIISGHQKHHINILRTRYLSDM